MEQDSKSPEESAPAPTVPPPTGQAPQAAEPAPQYAYQPPEQYGQQPAYQAEQYAQQQSGQYAPVPVPVVPPPAEPDKAGGRGRRTGGIILIALGAIFLAQYYLPSFDMTVVVALVLIIIGALLVFRSGRP